MKCKKEETGIEALPLATQEGKNTFGCLVNGEVFLPKGNFSSGNPINCFYQFAFNDQSYNLMVGASNNNNPYIVYAVSLKYRGPGNFTTGSYELNASEFSGEYFTVEAKINSFKTSDLFKGEMIITKFDQVNQIISGTFWFDAVNNKGEKVEVREGRFDVHYVK